MLIPDHNSDLTCRRTIALIVVFAGLFALLLFG